MPRHAVTGREKRRKATRNSQPATGNSPRVRDAHGQEWTAGPGAPEPHLDSAPSTQHSALSQARAASAARRIPPAVAENSTCPGCGGTITGDAIVYDYTAFRSAGSIGHPVRTVYAHCEHCSRTYAREQCNTGTLWVDRDQIELVTDAETIARVLAKINPGRGVVQVA